MMQNIIIKMLSKILQNEHKENELRRDYKMIRNAKEFINRKRGESLGKNE